MLLHHPMFYTPCSTTESVSELASKSNYRLVRVAGRPVYISSASCCIFAASGLRLFVFNTSSGKSPAYIRRWQTPSSQFFIDHIRVYRRRCALRQGHIHFTTVLHSVDNFGFHRRQSRRINTRPCESRHWC